MNFWMIVSILQAIFWFVFQVVRADALSANEYYAGVVICFIAAALISCMLRVCGFGKAGIAGTSVTLMIPIFLLSYGTYTLLNEPGIEHLMKGSELALSSVYSALTSSNMFLIFTFLLVNLTVGVLAFKRLR